MSRRIEEFSEIFILYWHSHTFFRPGSSSYFSEYPAVKIQATVKGTLVRRSQSEIKKGSKLEAAYIEIVELDPLPINLGIRHERRLLKLIHKKLAEKLKHRVVGSNSHDTRVPITGKVLVSFYPGEEDVIR